MVKRILAAAAFALIAVAVGGTTYDWYQTHRAETNQRDRRATAIVVASCIVPQLSTAAKRLFAVEKHGLGSDPHGTFQISSLHTGGIISAAEKQCPNAAYPGYIAEAVQEVLSIDSEFRTIEVIVQKQRQAELATFDAQRLEAAKAAKKKDAWMFKE